jgi:toxin ParE1/3/4
MPHPVIWSEDATQDLEKQLAFIARDNPQNARLVEDRLYKAVLLLSEMPEAGKEARRPNHREFAVPKTSHIIFYRITPNREILIARVIHGARHFPLGDFPT